ncbi:hypothetical protein [Stenotrophomonas sp.]|uniref:hypothetical protein n=1 Tax=Stenotrophomonas sp. TaxID=69392 RepID=UPI0028A2A7EB|nr:hypothetical protein [Stenotrophomonas sp.]
MKPDPQCFLEQRERAMTPALAGVWSSLAALMLLAPVAGCDRTSAPSSPSQDAGDQTKWWGLVKENRSPKQRVDFTWEVHDAPGPFAEVIARAQYDVVNEDECGFVHSMTGTGMRMTTSRDVILVRRATGEYSGTAFLDLLQDGDYYGRGICRWELTGAGVAFRATGADGETAFDAFIHRAPLLAGDSLTLYYPNIDYPRVAGNPNYSSFGAQNLEKFKSEIRAQTFTVELKGQGSNK